MRPYGRDDENLVFKRSKHNEIVEYKILHD